MWTLHPSFEDTSLMGRWLLQSLHIEFNSNNNSDMQITKTSFDEALIESLCYGEFEQFYDVMARRIQLFFKKYKNIICKMEKKTRKKNGIIPKQHHINLRTGAPMPAPRRPASEKTPLVQYSVGLSHRNLTLAKFSEKKNTTFSRNKVVTAPLAVDDLISKKPATSQQPTLSPGTRRVTTKAGQSKRNKLLPKFDGSTSPRLAMQVYFPPLPLALNQSILLSQKSPVDCGKIIGHNSLLDNDPKLLPSQDNVFNGSLDYFHSSIMSNAVDISMEDSADNNDEDWRYVRKYERHDGTNNMSNNAESSNSLVFCPRGIESTGHDQVNAILKKINTVNVDLSGAMDDMTVTVQYPRRMREKRKKAITSKVEFTEAQFRAKRIQALWKKAVRRIGLLRRVEALREDLQSDKKLIDSRLVNDALRDCLESGNYHVAYSLLERIHEVILTYDTKSAKDYSIYSPQTVDEYTTLIQVLNSFVSKYEFTSLGLQVLYLCLRKNSDTPIYDAHEDKYLYVGASGDVVAIMGSADVLDYLMVAFNRHASFTLSSDNDSADQGEEEETPFKNKVFLLCKDIIQFLIFLTSECPSNRRRFTKKRHYQAVNAMLDLSEDADTNDIFSLSLNFISVMSKSSDSICLKFFSMGVFDRVMLTLRKEYKNASSMLNIITFISKMVPSSAKSIIEDIFGSPLGFVVYTDCLVFYRQNPRNFKLVCHVIYLLCREGDSVMENLVSEYFAMATKAIAADDTSDKYCIAALLVLINNLREKFKPLDELFMGSDAVFDDDGEGLVSTFADMKDFRNYRSSSASSLLSLDFLGEENFNLDDDNKGSDKNEYRIDASTTDDAILESDAEVIGDEVAISRIQYLAINRFLRLKRFREFKETKEKAKILLKLVTKSNYFDQIADGLQTSLRIGHVDLAILTLERILTLIKESHQLKNSSLVAKTFIKNPKILIEIASSFLSVTKIQFLIWKTIFHLPFRFDVKTELDTLAMANVSGIFFWVLRRHMENVDLLEVCLSCVARITSENVIMQDRFGKESGLRVLARVMMQHNNVVRPMLFAAELIANICHTNVRNQQRCCAAGIPHLLVQSMIKHLHNDLVVGAVVSALISLCGQKNNRSVVMLMSSKHILLYLQIIKNNMNSLHVCSHMCTLLTSLTSGLGDGTNEANILNELQQSVITVEITAMLDKAAVDKGGSNHEVVHTIIMLIVHLIVSFPSLRLKFLNDGILRVLSLFKSRAVTFITC